MFRSYVSVAAILCLAAVVGCDSDNGTPGGSGGSAGGGGGGGSGTAVTKTVAVGCTNSFTSDVSSLDWELTADPAGPIVGGEPVEITFDGVAFFSQAFLDVAVLAIPGLRAAALNELNATALPRSGLTGEGVLLHGEPIPTTCYGGMNDGDACETEDDCEPVGYFLCTQVVDFPISEDCAPGGECDTLGKLDQCNVGDPAAGFCINGDLPLPLGAASGTFTAGDSGGTALLGWDDQNTTLLCDSGTAQFTEGCDCTGLEPLPGGETCANANPGGQDCSVDPCPALGQVCTDGVCDPVVAVDCPGIADGQTCDGETNTCNPTDTCSLGAPNLADDGTYELAPARFPEPLGPIGLKVMAGPIEVALNCTMAVDNGLDPTAVSPTPDEDLISFPIE